jgi:GLPGLI family protein
MKYIIYRFHSLVFLFGIFFGNAQINGFAIYKLQIAFDEEALEIDKQFGYIQSAIDVCDQLEYKLIFAGKESNFFQEKNDDLDLNAVNMANILSDSPKLSYQNIETKSYLCEIFTDGKIIKKDEFVLTDSLNVDWVISNETKMIDNYLCYKATFIKKVNKGDSIVNESVIAWFCPALPFSFGPTKYAGLPGLIIQLQEKNIAFTLKSYTIFKDSTISIKVPFSKKIITQSEYHKIFKERIENMETMFKE